MKLALLVFLALACTPAFAQEPGAGALRLLDKVITGKGIKKIGALNLETLYRDIGGIRWREKRGSTPEFAGDRKSAYYLIGKNEVYVSPNLPAFAMDSFDELELHESAGTLKLNDRNTSLTTAIHIVAQVKDKEFERQLVKEYGKTLFARNNLREDGGSSVGGGGDLIALSAKNQVLKTIMSDESDVTLEFLKSYPSINFEPVYKKAAQKVQVEFNARSMVRGLRENEVVRLVDESGKPNPRLYYEESITVYVPAIAWNGAKRAAITREMADLVLGLFPASPHAKRKTQMVWACNKRVSATFPMTNSPSAKAVQVMRLGLRPDCKSFYGYGDVSATFSNP